MLSFSRHTRCISANVLGALGLSAMTKPNFIAASGCWEFYSGIRMPLYWAPSAI